jgi:hypothetical protein
MGTQFFQQRYLDPLCIVLEDKEDLKDTILIDLRKDDIYDDIICKYGSEQDLINEHT